MHGAKCSHDPGATITTAPEEANNLMQLQQHSLQTQITGGQRHLQAEKVRPTKLRWMKWQKAVWRTVATEGPPTSARSFTLAAAFSFEMVCVKTCEGPLAKKIARKTRNGRRLIGGGVGA
jgi:hypothetical protein